MRFAFILMGAFDAERDRAAIGGGAAEIAGVSNLEEACAAAKRLGAAGGGGIELCGACGLAGVPGAGRKFPRILWRAGRRGHARRGRGLRKIA